MAKSEMKSIASYVNKSQTLLLRKYLFFFFFSFFLFFFFFLLFSSFVVVSVFIFLFLFLFLSSLLETIYTRDGNCWWYAVSCSLQRATSKSGCASSFSITRRRQTPEKPAMPSSAYENWTLSVVHRQATEHHPSMRSIRLGFVCATTIKT